MNISGIYEHGIDTKGDSRSRKTGMPRMVGTIERSGDVSSRSMGKRSAFTRMGYVRMTSMLLILCVATVLIVSAVAMTEASQTMISSEKAPPLPPHPIFGYTVDADGVTPLTSCDVVLTNKATGDTLVTTSDALGGIYSEDAANFLNGYAIGDIINVTATKGAQVGWNESAITDTPAGYDQIDVTLNGSAIPEFPMLILPVGGMIALFAVVSLKRKGKEQ
jgi:hypothetical protein